MFEPDQRFAGLVSVCVLGSKSTANILKSYVFEKKYLKHMEKLVQLLEETSAPYLVVLFESYYGHLRNQLFNFLGSHIKQKTIIPVYFCQSSKVDDLENELQNETKSRKYTIGHLEFELDSSVPRDQLQFVWLGNPDSSSFLRASLSLYPYVLDCYDDSTDSWIPAEGCALTTFKRRLRLISKSQNSCVFGIVVSAIATKGVLDAVERCEMVSFVCDFIKGNIQLERPSYEVFVSPVPVANMNLSKPRRTSSY